MLAACRHIGVVLIAFVLAACANDSRRTIPPGVAEAGKLRVTLDAGWYRAPGSETREKRSLTRVLTRDSVENERLYLVNGIDDGQTIFDAEYARGVAAFDVSMSPGQIADLVADSVGAALWGDTASVDARGIEERGFTGIPGVQFYLEASAAGSYRGVAGAFVAEEHLYAVIFLARSPGPYEQQEAAAERIIDSAILTVRTIHR